MDPLQLVELLRGHRTYIQTHNFPDPDAIASAFGLQHFLNYHGCGVGSMQSGSKSQPCSLSPSRLVMDTGCFVSENH